MNRFFFVLLLLIALAPARANDDLRQREKLSAAVKKGEILPLSDILKTIRPQIGGKIREIEFEYSEGTPIYELYVLDGAGRRLKYEIDARTAKILILKNGR
ncbi:PepSY domain-containing protein [Hoeflea sp. AS60]|uniref:PepSY domain-containing protein n=1 Tax=Hoeflea sp. AS60 TaxID=3135780 RepID=UPI00317776D8